MLKLRFPLLFAFLACLCAPLLAQSQNQNPVSWSARLQPAEVRAGESATIAVTAKIAAPWYIYAPSTPPGGPNPTTITLLPSPVAKTNGKVGQPKPKKHFDEGFQLDTETFEKSVTFRVPIQLQKGAKGAQKLTVSVRYQACNNRLCLPPKTVQVPVAFSVAPGAARAANLAAITTGEPTSPGVSEPPKTALNTPADSPANAATDSTKNATSRGLLAYLGVAFGAGFLALLTPCVFPMIPITVSFFTKRSESKQTGISGPVAFCAGIIGTFTLVGVAASIIFGAAGIARFAANPYVNLALAGLFIVLALNLFGVFEITVPAALLNRVSPGGKNSGKGGLLAPLLMGFAFTLTSFTCTVPFVGTALFAAATGGWVYPALGMLAFSTAFASPFFLLALFPGWLSKMPRAGGWLVSVKAFMGFLELAAALKFLSNVDLVWQLGILTRPVFLAVWFALALLSGLWLWRLVRLPKDEENARPGPFRLGLGAVMVGVSMLLLGAMNGARLGDFDAYVPPDDYGQNAAVRETAWLKNDLEGAQKLAKAQNKPLLINFTGYACTNCRLMEKNVLPHREVVKELENYVAVELYTDGTDAKSQKFNQFQQDKFGTIAIPLYAVVEPNGAERGRLEGLESDPAKFAAFLNLHRDASRLASTKK